MDEKSSEKENDIRIAKKNIASFSLCTHYLTFQNRSSLGETF